MYLGTSVDGAFKVKAPTTLELKRTPRSKVHQYADGSTSATVFGSMQGNESWEATYDYTPAGSVSLLESMASDPAWHKRGTGLQFIPTGGERVNLLTRAEAESYTNMYYSEALVSTEDGPVLGAIVTGGATSRTIIASGIPILDNSSQYIFSAYARGAAQIAFFWFNAAGGTIGSPTTVNLSGGTTYTRVSTALPTPPSSARSVTLQMGGDYTRPALTSGTALHPWGAGQRIDGAIVESGDGGVEWAGDTGPGSETYVSRSYRITELGA